VTQLPRPTTDDVDAWVDHHLGHLVCDPGSGARGGHRGGQSAADAALATLDITGYARRRSMVHPTSARGASGLSPYVRHGLLSLAEVIDAVRDAPSDDRRKFVDEVWWQEYCRHLYSRVGTQSRAALRREPAVGSPVWDEPLPDDMACMRRVRDELESTGWLVNQTRMWAASHWTVRAGHDWAAGEDWMFRHLLDGSRAANRYGWQWSVGAMTSKPYGFSRWQVEKRARAWCTTCPRRDDCPIQDWPAAESGAALDDAWLRDGDDLAGPRVAEIHGVPEVVWLTAESLGTRDPALAAHTDLPAVFVFDEPLLARLRLSRKRLVFLTETLAELAETRPVELFLGRPGDELRGRPLAVTFAPVPGFAARAEALEVAALHPYPWLVRPTGRDVTSHSAWVRHARRRTRA
jgi:deoxyribodipyrimidine photo-lyase